jgi:acid stress-induced BolA-like protein IbaG/YrbA
MASSQHFTNQNIFMQIDEIRHLLAEQFADAHIEVTLDGGHVNITVISSAFVGLNPVKKQQLVYAVLAEPIASGAIHAVNMKTYTPVEWQTLATS